METSDINIRDLTPWLFLNTAPNSGLQRDSQDKSRLLLYKNYAGNTADAVRLTNDLLTTLRDSKKLNGNPTEIAKRLARLDANGGAEFIVGRGLKDETYPLDENGNRDMTRARAGIVSFAQINLDPYNSDALSGLAHELDHAYLLNRGEQQSAQFGEWDPVAIENEIRVLNLGLPVLTQYQHMDLPKNVPRLYLDADK